jgi:hypothetical protein
MYSALFAKEMVTDMVEAYEAAYIEDVKLECGMAVFKDFNSAYIS